MTFTMDTSGIVVFPLDEKQRARPPVAWENLSPFTQGYIEALMEAGVWGQTCEPCAGNGEIVADWDRYLGAPEPGDQGDEGTADCPACDGQGKRTIGFSDLAPETLARIIADCEAWRSEFTGRTAETSAGRADMGREFWRIRNAGYRSLFPPLTVQLGDDGRVRFGQ